MICQLRTYTVNRGMMDQWVKYFNDAILPMHEKHGIKIDGAWVNEDKNQFIWIRTYSDAEDMKTRQDALYAAPEWKALVEKARSHLARTVFQVMEPVLKASSSS